MIQYLNSSKFTWDFLCFQLRCTTRYIICNEPLNIQTKICLVLANRFTTNILTELLCILFLKSYFISEARWILLLIKPCKRYFAMESIYYNHITRILLKNLHGRSQRDSWDSCPLLKFKNCFKDQVLEKFTKNPEEFVLPNCFTCLFYFFSR